MRTTGWIVCTVQPFIMNAFSFLGSLPSLKKVVLLFNCLVLQHHLKKRAGGPFMTNDKSFAINT